jgi:mannose-1-phosphate guanylyltransferase/mannose-1-phosphate guanylyltransferase/mannose-6-phosphate isomerase
MAAIIPVILCGGGGTRLWPRSRARKPKPFLPLVDDEPLFVKTVARCPADAGFGEPVVVTGIAHLAHVQEQLGDRPGALIIVEPAARNTAAAIALAAMRLPGDAVMLVCPSDHYIGDSAAFAAAARAAAVLAEEGWLVALGIAANSPETGFGYIKRGEPLGAEGFRIAKFVEKPDSARAAAFLADGSYAWNGGIFAFRARDFLAELETHRPAIAEAVRRAVELGRGEGREFHPDGDSFAAVESESIDYAVMENTTRAAMVPANMQWSDIGNWRALHAARPRDAAGNSVSGPVELIDCRNVLVDSDGPRVSAIGLDGVIVVVDGDDILVTTAAGVQMVGKLSGAANQ